VSRLLEAGVDVRFTDLPARGLAEISLAADGGRGRTGAGSRARGYYSKRRVDNSPPFLQFQFFDYTGLRIPTAWPRKVSDRKMLRKVKEFARHFK